MIKILAFYAIPGLLLDLVNAPVAPSRESGKAWMVNVPHALQKVAAKYVLSRNAFNVTPITS